MLRRVSKTIEGTLWSNIDGEQLSMDEVRIADALTYVAGSTSYHIIPIIDTGTNMDYLPSILMKSIVLKECIPVSSPDIKTISDVYDIIEAAYDLLIKLYGTDSVYNGKINLILVSTKSVDQGSPTIPYQEIYGIIRPETLNECYKMQELVWKEI